MGGNRWIHLMFAVGGLLAALFMVNFTTWIWGYFGKPNDLAANGIGITLGLLAAFLAWRNENLFSKASEVITELKKVTWPTRKETQTATVVVIITVIIASAFLGLFDVIWSWATGLIYA